MCDKKELPPLPTPPSATTSGRRKRRSGAVLKPESPWATRIRELLGLNKDGIHYMPYMPWRKNRGLQKALRKITDSKRGKKHSSSD